jgi:DHA1 family bicyclomycin/chloramphenicol resistance-like MFS transporter
MLVLIMMMGSYPPMTTDIYLAALPGISKLFGVDPILTNLTLVLFFVFFAAGMLVWGPLSDRWGRKPVIYVTTFVYTLASLLCAASWNIYALIGFRVIQALGAAGAVTVALAMIKDVYPPEKREKVFAVIGTIMGLAPVVAPVIGAELLKVTDWRGIFFVLAGLGAASMFGTVLIHETCHERNDGNLLMTLGRLFVVLKNPSFTIMIGLFCTQMIPILSFVGAAPYIYMEHFGLSETTFSRFFAANALILSAGPMAYVFLARFVQRRTIITGCFIAITVGGLLVMFFGNYGYWWFALVVLPAGLGVAVSRPARMALCLEQQEGDTGSASSLINFSFAMAGSVGLLIVSFDWGWINRVQVLGIVFLVVGIYSILLWPIALRHRRRRPS